MKKQIVKFYKIFIFLFFLFFYGINNPSFSYETVIINFPENEGWHLEQHIKKENGTIVQYMPRGEDKSFWTRTVVFHSYPNAIEKNLSPILLQQRMLSSVSKKNKSFQYKNIKVTKDDTLTIWCVKKNEYMPGQCEILRTSKGYESVVSMHYINKNINSLKQIEKNWIYIIKDVKHYYSYFRTERILNRETSFEF